ncbi:MAG: hypothetical protein IT235_01190 [Bacteroidia bacterium]|nr:hypothetical protein [Bacteroidia bacterium]
MNTKLYPFWQLRVRHLLMILMCAGLNVVYAQTVTVDAVSSAQSVGAVTTLTWSHTTTTSYNNTVLVVSISTHGSNNLASSVTYNGQALTNKEKAMPTTPKIIYAMSWLLRPQRDITYWWMAGMLTVQYECFNF